MRIIILNVIVLCIIMSSNGSSQLEYTRRDESTSSLGFTFSRLNDFDTFGLQYGFSGDGREAIGLFGTINNADNQGLGVGLFFDGALIKPRDQSFIGIDLLLSGSLSWNNVQTLTLYKNETYTGKAASIGGEFYLLPPEEWGIPFIQLVRSFEIVHRENVSASTSLSSLGAGCEFFINYGSRPKLIITPGIIWTNLHQIIIEIDFSVVLKRSVKKQH